MKTGAELIELERVEQMQKHGFTPDKDQVYTDKQLLSAALSALFQDRSLFIDTGTVPHPSDYWPTDFDKEFLQKISDKDRISQLVVAGALIAAEIDRLQSPQIQQVKTDRALLVQKFAQALNGREYRCELYPQEERKAKENGIVIVFGQSDDLMIAAGIICEEYGAVDKDVYYIIKTKKGSYDFREAEDLSEDTDLNSLPKITIRRGTGKEQDELGEFYWYYQTDIPHATFDIKDGGENFCRGIVFHIDDALETALKIKARQQA